MIAVNVENKIAIKKSNQNNKILFTNGSKGEEDGSDDKPTGREQEEWQE